MVRDHQFYQFTEKYIKNGHKHRRNTPLIKPEKDCKKRPVRQQTKQKSNSEILRNI